MGNLPEQRGFPYRDGDVTVIGPEAIIDNDGTVISYKGQHFVSQGRTTVDNTVRKWVGRVLATIGLLTVLLLIAAAFGLHALFT